MECGDKQERTLLSTQHMPRRNQITKYAIGNLSCGHVLEHVVLTASEALKTFEALQPNCTEGVLLVGPASIASS